MGIQIKAYPSQDIQRRLKIMNLCKINLLLDIGANTGQYAESMRSYGYNGRIVSFEPLHEAYKQLQKVAGSDPNWTLNNYALGNTNSNGLIHVAGNSVSSSILEMLDAHEKSAPESEYISTENIEIKTLDSIFHKWYKAGDRVMIKIDTQGYEKQVLEGTKESLKLIKIIQVEMSLLPLYKSGWLYQEIISFLKGSGFELYSLENGFTDKDTGRLLQVDGIFVNTKLYL